jgi:drug/metabolite transporter (DMT)-like permease
VVQIGVAYSLYSVAIRHVTALDASIILLLEPLLNPLWTFFFLREVPGPWAILGAIIILGAITLQTTLPYVREKRELR